MHQLSVAGNRKAMHVPLAEATGTGDGETPAPHVHKSTGQNGGLWLQLVIHQSEVTCAELLTQGMVVAAAVNEMVRWGVYEGVSIRPGEGDGAVALTEHKQVSEGQYGGTLLHTALHQASVATTVREWHERLSTGPVKESMAKRVMVCISVRGPSADKLLEQSVVKNYPVFQK